MVLETNNNNKPTQSNLVSLNQHSIVSWKLKQIFVSNLTYQVTCIISFCFQK